MSKMDHFQLMSTYNIRMNRQVYNAALSLPEALREQDMGAFFKSISGTLNHILVGDVIWFSRFAKHSENYLSLCKLPKLSNPRP
ncbi:DinB family protein [Marinomonas dokdonensis]|uniref:DinB family protein n=1 Tax=Marinomonas dokdonensis TaxID=328224 RepID=UPI00405543DB